MNTHLLKWYEQGAHVLLNPAPYSVFYRDFYQSGFTQETVTADQTLLLLHGFPESSFSFHKVIEGLLGHFKRVLVFDMVGYGFSDKPTNYTYSLMDQADMALLFWRHMKVTGGHVLAHDMGTSVLTEMVARQRFEQFPAWFSDGLKSITFTNGSMVLGLAKLRLMQKLLLTRFGAQIGQFSGYSLFHKTVESAHGVAVDQTHGLETEDITLLWENCLQQNGHQKNHLIIRYLKDRQRFEQDRWLAALSEVSNTVPTHICWGTQDQVARLAMAVYLKEHICPNAQLTFMQGAGHFCQLGSPTLWCDSVLPFYNQV